MAGLGSLDQDQQSLLRRVSLNDAFSTMQSLGGSPYQPRAQSLAMQMLQKAAADRAAQQKQQAAYGAIQSMAGGQPQGVSNNPAGGAPSNPQPAAQPQGFLGRLAQMESGGDPNAVFNGPRGAYVGQYQIGADRLSDYNRATGDNIPLMALQDPAVSQRVAQWHVNDIDAFIDSPQENLAAMEGQKVKGVTITRDGMRAAAHLGGKQGLWKFLATDGKYDPADANGTRMSDYLRKFEDAALPGPKWSANTQRTLAEVAKLTPVQRVAQDPAFQAYAAMDAPAALKMLADQSVGAAFEAPPGPKVVGNSLVSAAGDVLYTDPQSGGSFRPATPQEAASYGAQYGQFDEEGRFYQTSRPGMSIETGPDGSFRFSQGGGAGLGRAGQNALDVKEIDARDQLVRLENIESQLADPDILESLTLRGNLKKWGLGWKDYINADNLTPEQQEYLTKTTMLRGDVLENLNFTIKAITGAAMTEAEAKRIGATLPNVDQSPAEFEANLRRSLSRTRAAIARYNVWRSQGLGGRPEDIDPLPTFERKMNEEGQRLRAKVTSGELTEEQAAQAFFERFGI